MHISDISWRIFYQLYLNNSISSPSHKPLVSWLDINAPNPAKMTTYNLMKYKRMDITNHTLLIRSSSLFKQIN